MERDDVQPVKQVFPERALFGRRFEVRVRGRKDTNIRLDRLHSAHPLKLALLEHAEQLDLERGIELAYFIEKKRAALSQLEPAGPRINSPGKSAFLVAEELRGKKSLGIAAQFSGTKGPRARLVLL